MINKYSNCICALTSRSSQVVHSTWKTMGVLVRRPFPILELKIEISKALGFPHLHGKLLLISARLRCCAERLRRPRLPELLGYLLVSCAHNATDRRSRFSQMQTQNSVSVLQESVEVGAVGNWSLSNYTVTVSPKGISVKYYCISVQIDKHKSQKRSVHLVSSSGPKSI